MDPVSGAVMLTIIRMVVVFPAPFGPSSPNTLPARTDRLRSLTAVNSPKLLLTPSSFTVTSLAAIQLSPMFYEAYQMMVFDCHKNPI
jgi:hypothetical protein